MTTDVEPAPLTVPIVVPSRPRIAHALMMAATRIGWAEPELRGLAQLVKEGDEVIDIGASHGMYTAPLAHLVGPTGRVHSFEPHPRQQRTLRRLKRALGARHVIINDAAVGSAEGEFTMRLPVRFGLPIYGHAHIADGAADYPSSVRIHTWSTPMTTVDAWAESNGASRVTFIKVDVEGFEPSVIAGGHDTIDRYRPSLLLEIEDRHLTRYAGDANHFADELRTTWPDYRMYTWGGTSWVPTERVQIGTRNYLFATDAALART